MEEDLESGSPLVLQGGNQPPQAASGNNAAQNLVANTSTQLPVAQPTNWLLVAFVGVVAFAGLVTVLNYTAKKV